MEKYIKFNDADAIRVPDSTETREDLDRFVDIMKDTYGFSNVDMEESSDGETLSFNTVVGTKGSDIPEYIVFNENDRLEVPDSVETQEDLDAFVNTMKGIYGFENVDMNEEFDGETLSFTTKTGTKGAYDEFDPDYDPDLDEDALPEYIVFNENDRLEVPDSVETQEDLDAFVNTMKGIYGFENVDMNEEYDGDTLFFTTKTGTKGSLK